MSGMIIMYVIRHYIIKLYLLLLSLRITDKERKHTDVTTYTILYNKRKKTKEGERPMIGSKLNTTYIRTLQQRRRKDGR